MEYNLLQYSVIFYLLINLFYYKVKVLSDSAQMFHILYFLCDFLRKKHINKDFDMNLKTKV